MDGAFLLLSEVDSASGVSTAASFRSGCGGAASRAGDKTIAVGEGEGGQRKIPGTPRTTKAAAGEKELSTRFAWRISGALDDSGQLTQVRSNVDHPGCAAKGPGLGESLEPYEEVGPDKRIESYPCACPRRRARN